MFLRAGCSLWRLTGCSRSLVIFSAFDHNTPGSRTRILSVLTLLNTTESGSRKAKNDTKREKKILHVFQDLGVLCGDLQVAPGA
jgi:hypothetical protein